MNETKIQCANCGGIGHVYKKCNHPLISFGIICYRVVNSRLMYLMVQRKDSLSYVEFLRGKFDIDQCKYILQLITNMTKSERNNLLTNDFNTLWRKLWQTDDCKGFQREYADAKNKFEHLKRGFYVRAVNNDTYFFDIKFAVHTTKGNLQEPEWGFPKGRRNINENDIKCAFREFKEETGIHPLNVSLLTCCKPYEEVFSGSNNVMYKHIYYIGTCNKAGELNSYNPNNRVQSREIKDMRWMPYEESQNHILDKNIERKELFKRVHNMLVKKIF
jgi:8-oxo-dGTP pyrophosphatase MutT (NUDIX family)